MKTILITIETEADLPPGLLKTLEARAYDYIHAKGGFCGEVTAKLNPLIELPVEEMEASE
jgi:hypothetical protein